MVWAVKLFGISGMSLMDKQQFLASILTANQVMIRTYRAGQRVDPSIHIFVPHRPYVQTHLGQLSLITPNFPWAEYSPKYDIESFDGTTMVFAAEDYIMEVRLC